MASGEKPGFWGDVQDFLLSGCGGNTPCIWYIFGGAYGILALATLVQLIRIQRRLSEFGWTMQKTFHVFNLFVCSLRCISLCLWNNVESSNAEILEVLLFDVPSLLFFTTYTLLVLFWAEIVHAAKPRAIPPRVAYGVLNVVAYCVAAIFWILCAVPKTGDIGKILDSILQICLNIGATVAFLVYGHRLLSMLRDSPVQSRNVIRSKKIMEVALVTVLATLCFLGKAVLEIISIATRKGLDYDGGFLYDSLFYGITEILVIATSLGVLSGMPPKRRPQQYETLMDKA
ncbi:hypothetical protein BSKO_12308 [Bryopsis sp. KO-2023]|nr:hypothetical protein BSKO_12308 [Bryopsis sp. KO-2023]